MEERWWFSRREINAYARKAGERLLAANGGYYTLLDVGGFDAVKASEAFADDAPTQAKIRNASAIATVQGKQGIGVFFYYTRQTARGGVPYRHPLLRETLEVETVDGIVPCVVHHVEFRVLPRGEERSGVLFLKRV